jgi:hypothetical protein
MNTPAQISPLRYPLPWWRYALLFQSLGQFQSWTFLVVATAAVMQTIFIVLGNGAIPVVEMLATMAIGALFSVYMVVPASLTLSCAGALPSLISEIESMHYVPAERNLNQTIFHQRLPRLLRWKEGNISIEKSGDLLHVNGPAFILKILRKKLLK